MSDALFEHHRIVVDAHQMPMRIDVFLTMRIAALSRTRLQVGMRGGYVHVNGEVVKVSYKVRPGDVVQIYLPRPREEIGVVAEEMDLDVVYEDAHVLVVNKPAELVVHPGVGHKRGTLVNGLVHYLRDLPFSEGNEGRPGLLHRLDKGTSGLVAVAKTEEALGGLSRQFTERTIGRTYLLLVWGDLPTEEGCVRRSIGRSPSDRKKMAVFAEGEGGKYAVTHYKVVERLGYVTLVECRLETGRTHQIRVHMASIGHPVFGDPLYGGNRIVKGQTFSKYKAFVQNCFALLPHQALHAGKLCFLHPVQGQKVEVEVPMPKAFRLLLERWRRYTRGFTG